MSHSQKEFQVYLPAASSHGSNGSWASQHLGPGGNSNVAQQIPANQASLHSNQHAFAQNGSIGWPQFTHLPASTQEILKRAGTPTSFSPNSPQWAAAREQVMKSMAAGPDGVSPLAQTLPARGKPNGRPRGSGVGGDGRSASASEAGWGSYPVVRPGALSSAKSESELNGLITPPSNRARGRGGRPRGRGSGRGRGRGKRKREDDTDGELTPSDEENSDAQNDSFSQPTITKSGRNVQRPSQFNPASAESPTSGTKRRRSYHRSKDPEKIICAKCLRGHSPPSNSIVLCDGCEMAYHQWCHDPTIPIEVTQYLDKTWFCGTCQHDQEIAKAPLEHRISGSHLSHEQKHTYLSSLSAGTLLSLLMHAAAFQPDLPIFPPEVVAKSNSNSDPTTRTTNSKSTNPPTSQPAATISSSNHTTSTAPIRQASTTAMTTSVTAQPHNDALVRSQAPTDLTVPPKTSSDSHLPITNSHPTRPSQPSIPQAAKEPDPYPDYSDFMGDPPATYPRPGKGPYQIRPTTAPEDLPWLLDDNYEVFSHLVANTKGAGTGNGSGDRNGTGDVIKLERDRAGEWVGKGRI